jgi:hypothetical protein
MGGGIMIVLHEYLVSGMFSVMNLVEVIERWIPQHYQAGACLSGL